MPKPRGVVGCLWGAFAGVVSACLLAFVTRYVGTPLILLGYLSAVPLFMAGMGAGIVPGAIAAFVGTAGLFALAPVSDGLYYLVADAVPVLGLIALAMSAHVTVDGKLIWSSEGKMMTALVAYPCVIFLLVYFLMMGQQGGLLAATVDLLNGVSDQIIKLLIDHNEKVTPDTILQLHQYIELSARIIPTLLMCGWLFSTLISCVVAQVVLQQKKWDTRPAFALENLQVPVWTIFAAAAFGTIASFAPAPYDYVALNLALVMGVPFFFAGLAVLHAWAALTRAPTLALAVLYVFMMLIVYLVLLVALLGVVDQWVDFRKRFAEQN